MQSRHTNGTFSGAAQSQGIICRRDWHGLSRTQKRDFSCTERVEFEPEARIVTLATPGRSPGADRPRYSYIGGALTRGRKSKQLRATTNRPGRRASCRGFDSFYYLLLQQL